MPRLHCKIDEFNNDESGVGTAWALSWLILCFAIAGLSVDITNAWKIRQVLQTTADVSAHAGAIELGTVGNSSIEGVVAQAANRFAETNMNSNRYGDVLVDSDIQVGYWNGETRRFVQIQPGDTEQPTAVRAITRQEGGASAVVGTFFLRFAGFDDFKVSTSSTVERFISQCESDGIKTRGETKLSTGQVFDDEYCVYGREGFDLSNHNYFAPGTVAAMADLADCGPSANHCENDHNDGIEQALRQYWMDISKIDKIDEYIAELQNPRSDLQPDYINPARHVVRVQSSNFDPATLQKGRVYIINCSAGENLRMGVTAGSNGNNGNGNGKPNDPSAPDPQTELVASEFVLIGLGCDFVFDDTVAYEDVIFATTSTSNQTISGSAGVVLGRDDDCAPGGEVVAITKGSVKFAAKVSMFDVEFIVQNEVHLAAHGQGDSVHVGTNIQAGGDVQVTTSHSFSGCLGETPSDFDLKYSYRFVQ